MKRRLRTDSHRTSGGPALSARPPARSVYGHDFWLAYVANALTMAAFSMLVRYADFVAFLGGAEAQLGLIVGIGMVGSLAMRMAQGAGIDRYGPRRVWLGSLTLFVASLLSHLWITSATGPGIFAARILMQTSIAGVFGASITYISRRVPPERMAEIVGTLGTSGFVGILIGPQLSDWIYRGPNIGREQLDRLFWVAALLAIFALLATWLATAGELPPARRRRPGLLALMRRYHPGSFLLVASAVGAGLAVPHTFLRPFAAERGIASIGTFFAVYAVTAFTVRLMTRRLFARYGNRPWVLVGLVTMAASLLLYLVVHQSWQLAIPGAVAGVAHALLFPAVVAGGSTSFPERHRGLGTMFILAMFDLGNLVDAPLVGGILHGTRQAGMPAYPVMLSIVAAPLTLAALFFAWRSRRPTGATMPSLSGAVANSGQDRDFFGHRPVAAASCSAKSQDDAVRTEEILSGARDD